MRILLLCITSLSSLAAGPGAQPRFQITPDHPRQGELLQLSGPPAAVAVTFRGHQVSLYAGAESGESEGVLAIPVLTSPGIYSLTWIDRAGSVLQTSAVPVANAHYATQNITLSPSLSSLRSTPDERSDVGAFLSLDTPRRYWTLPIQPPLESCLTSPFGVQRLHNGKPTGDFHSGLDQRGAAGTPIHAAAAGIVRLAGQFALHGGTVGIDHGQGLESMYLHMSGIAVQAGETVRAGSIVGYVGSTGRSTAPHLHWALYAHGEPVNPLQWLSLQPCAAAAPARAKRQRMPLPK